MRGVRTGRQGRSIGWQSALAVLACVAATPAGARVSEDDAARLGSTLTPIGAERSGNADGTIPAWDGGLRVPPSCFKGPGAR